MKFSGHFNLAGVMNKIYFSWEGRSTVCNCLVGIQKSPWSSPSQMKINPEEASAHHAVDFFFTDRSIMGC